MKILSLFFAVFLNLNSCSSEKKNQEVNSYIEKVTYQNWVGGVKGAGGGTILNITLLKSLPSNIALIKIQFQNREETIIKVNDFSYQASIKTFDNKQETIPTPTIKTDLKPNQAKVFFKVDGKESFIIIDNVKEIPMLAYPSINKRN